MRRKKYPKGGYQASGQNSPAIASPKYKLEGSAKEAKIASDLRRDATKAKRNRERIAAKQDKTYKTADDLRKFRPGSMPLNKDLRWEKPSQGKALPHVSIMADVIKAVRHDNFQPSKAAREHLEGMAKDALPAKVRKPRKAIQRTWNGKPVRLSVYNKNTTRTHGGSDGQSHDVEYMSASQQAFIEMSPDEIEAIKGKLCRRSMVHRKRSKIDDSLSAKRKGN